jgi:predicted DsbA family dithiol-disulfide isomerase
LADVDWRAVEHDRAIPVPSEAVEGDLAAMLDREVTEVRNLLRPNEAFSIHRPTVHPNSGVATAAFAAAADRSNELRRRLFAALWVHGRDIGDRSVLTDLGADEGGDPARVATWRAEWSAFDRGVVPMLVEPGGDVWRGLEALDRLAELAS